MAAFLAEWRGLAAEGDFAPRLAEMRAANPIVIARNHRVEQALASASEGDLAPLRRLCAALKDPCEAPAPGPEESQGPPLPDECVRETFCGT